MAVVITSVLFGYCEWVAFSCVGITARCVIRVRCVVWARKSHTQSLCLRNVDLSFRLFCEGFHVKKLLDVECGVRKIFLNCVHLVVLGF